MDRGKKSDIPSKKNADVDAGTSPVASGVEFEEGLCGSFCDISSGWSSVTGCESDSCGVVEVDEVANGVDSSPCGREDWEFSGVAASKIVDGCNSTLLEPDSVWVLVAESPLGNDCGLLGGTSNEDDVLGTSSSEEVDRVRESSSEPAELV